MQWYPLFMQNNGTGILNPDTTGALSEYTFWMTFLVDLRNMHFYFTLQEMSLN